MEANAPQVTCKYKNISRKICKSDKQTSALAQVGLLDLQVSREIFLYFKFSMY